MLVVEDAWNAVDPPRRTVATIGNFDALHRGHQALIRDVVERARALGTQAGLITFEPHPVQVLRPQAGLRRLTTRRQKLEQVAAQGVDVMFLIHFDRGFAEVEAATFADELLGRRLAVREVHVGRRFRFGRGRAGDIELLRASGGRWGYSVLGVDELLDDGKPVSSTRIRRAVASGEVELATRLLGRPYAIEGIVATGDGRGRQLGWPTANLDLTSELAPAQGVYIAEALGVDDRAVPAAVNIGVRPTTEHLREAPESDAPGPAAERASIPEEPVVEAHLLDFDRDLYGHRLELAFLRRLRGERRFADLDALEAQIGRDVEAVREYFLAARR